MSVGLLLVTHCDIAQSLLDTACNMLGSRPLKTKVLSVRWDNDPDELINKAMELVDELNEGEGVVVLTDMYGSTPSNIATKLRSEQVAVVTGLNLPMLVRVLNYPKLSLVQLVDKAMSGGREGIFNCDQGVE